MPLKSKPNNFSCIQIITPKSSPTSSCDLFPSFLSYSEFDPVLYREEILRKSYLSRFPIDSCDRPDYLITIGNAKYPCSTLTIDVKSRRDKSGQYQLPLVFIASSFLIIIIFIIMLYIYLTGFVTFHIFK